MIAPLPVVCIFGPTAVGKTDLLLSLFPAECEIISADSMQVYRGLDIGTAKPSKDLQKRIPHHLIDIKEPSEQYTVGDFVRSADPLVRDIYSRGKIPIISGGTAFYLKTFLFGLPRTPPSDKQVRKQLKQELVSKGVEVLYDELCRVDPQSGDKIAVKDSYRILRALEVIRSTGKPFSSFSPPESFRPDYTSLLICLTREREELYRRINGRVEDMFERGLVEEIKGLIAAGYSSSDPGLRGIGYREFFEMGKEGCIALSGIKERIKQNSRRYAKRQMTFFKSIPKVVWISPEEREAIEPSIRDFFFG